MINLQLGTNDRHLYLLLVLFLMSKIFCHTLVYTVSSTCEYSLDSVVFVCFFSHLNKDLKFGFWIYTCVVACNICLLFSWFFVWK